jgi:hypothetical protein
MVKKLTLGLLATITHKIVPFCAYAPFPALLPFFKYTLEAVLCEGVHHRLQFCPHHLICVKMAAFQFYLQPGKQFFLSPKFREKSWHIFTQSL